MLLANYKELAEADQSSLSKFFLSVEKNPLLFDANEKDSFLKLLLNDLKNKQWTEDTKTQALSVIRTLGRDPTGSDAIFSEEGMSTLLRIAGLHKDVESKDTVTTREALKCIANSIYLKADIKIFLEREQVHSICRSILQTREHLSQEAQFLLCRILFFLTIDRADLVRDLVQSDIAISLEKVLTQNVAQIANEISRKQINRNTPINAYTVTSEALKLLFNILLTGAKAEECNEDYAKIFKGSLGSIFRLLTQVPFPEPQPLIPPHSQAIHSLMQFPYNIVAEKWSAQNEWAAGCYDMKEDKKDLSYLTEKLAGAFNCSIRSLIPSGLPDEDGNKQVDATLAPLILVFVSFADNNNKLKAGLSKHLLPSDNDRLKPVHEGNALSAYLIRLMTSTMLPQSRDATSELLFTLCDKDPNKLTEQIGYGNAVGFLVNKGIAVKPPASGQEAAEDINPITGQFVSSEPELELKDMTDEEKEREAERLFVLFERLKKTGIVDVENPVAKAMRESQGRFEEIEDNDSDSN